MQVCLSNQSNVAWKNQFCHWVAMPEFKFGYWMASILSFKLSFRTHINFFIGINIVTEINRIDYFSLTLSFSLKLSLSLKSTVCRLNQLVIEWHQFCHSMTSIFSLNDVNFVIEWHKFFYSMILVLSLNIVINIVTESNFAPEINFVMKKKFVKQINCMSLEY